jgi:hypothetical protein
MFGKFNKLCRPESWEAIIAVEVLPSCFKAIADMEKVVSRTSGTGYGCCSVGRRNGSVEATKASGKG